jgi:hypothetical protein
VQLHWNSKVKSYEEKEDSVVVHFENQADVTANVLIAGEIQHTENNWSDVQLMESIL